MQKTLLELEEEIKELELDYLQNAECSKLYTTAYQTKTITENDKEIVLSIICEQIEIIKLLIKAYIEKMNAIYIDLSKRAEYNLYAGRIDTMLRALSTLHKSEADLNSFTVTSSSTSYSS